MIDVVVVEDHPVYRAGLAQVIDQTDGIALVGTYARVEDLVLPVPAAAAAAVVAILDLGLPGLKGADAVVHVTALGYRVLVVSASSGRSDLLGAIGAGARGFLGKEAEQQQIIHAIRAVASGQSFISPTLASLLLESEEGQPTFSGRERQILEQLAEGASDKAIARDLGIKLCTVHSHLERIRNKTGRRRRADLTRLAIEHGFVPTPATDDVRVTS